MVRFVVGQSYYHSCDLTPHSPCLIKQLCLKYLDEGSNLGNGVGHVRPLEGQRIFSSNIFDDEVSE